MPEVGAWMYSEHPTTEILCAAYAWEGGDVKLWRQGEPIPPEWTEADEYIARNAKFEYAMIANCGVKRHGFPKQFSEPWRWYDTQALCRNAGFPGGLDGSAQAMQLTQQKDKAGEALIKKISIPRRTAKGVVWPTVTPEEMQAMYDYCMQDVRTDMEAWEKLKSLPTFAVERNTWLIDFMTNIRGLRVDVPALDAVLKAYNELSAQAEKECEALGVNVRSTKAFPEWLRMHGVNVKSIQKAEIGKIFSSNPKVRQAVELREFLGLASVKKLQALKDTTSADGFCRYLLNYYGAGTGRWSGQGVQVHNLTKAVWEKDDKPLEIIQAEIDKIKRGEYDRRSFGEIIKRIIPGLFIPRDGYCFVMGDFKGIECRVAAYISNCEPMLKVLREKGDLYVAMASALYRTPQDKITKQQRAVGKALILGCQYGMSAEKFMEFCKTMKIRINDVEAAVAVNAYRTTYKEIPQSWKTYEQAFEMAWSKKKEVRAGMIVFTGYKSYVKVQLPFGRAIYYHKPEYDGRQLSVWNYSRNCRVDLWGAIIYENVSQGIARDILADRMVVLTRAGISIPLTVHDEIVCEVPTDNQRADLINSVLNHAPQWLPGFPLETDIETGATSYHK